MREEQIKNILSLYIKIDVDQITEATIIDRSVVASSIILHRMYATFAGEGFVLDNYTEIKDYGQLLSGLKNKPDIDLKEILQSGYPVLSENSFSEDSTSIGIDIESINHFSVVNDYREDEFYKISFSAGEIAYCILQPNPPASFAGLFAAKEAIIKADNGYKKKRFHTIVIDHLPNGKPVHQGIKISISHTSELAIAVAIKLNRNLTESNDVSLYTPPPLNKINFRLIAVFAILAMILSLLAVFLILFRHS